MERKYKKLLILFISFLLLFGTLISANYDEAYNLYLSGLKAYRSGEYKSAQQFLEEALNKSPKIEDEIPEIKLYLGLAAFQNKNYDLSYQFLSLFPNNALAKESIRNIENNLIAKEIDLGDLVIKNPTSNATTIEANKSNFNLGSFITITLIIFIISLLSAIGVWFLLRRYSTIDFSKSKDKNSESYDEIIEPEEEINPISLEEVINLKLDNLETIWQKSKALKKLLGEIDEDVNYENNLVEETEEKTNKLKKMIDDSMKDVDLDELENILDNYDEEDEEETNTEEEIQKADDNSVDDSSEINTEEIKKDTKKLEEPSIEEVENEWKESSDTIKPDQNSKNIFNKIMNENEDEIIREAENFNDLDSLIEDIETSNKEKGRKENTQAQLESIFKTNFFEINDEKIN